MNYRRLMANASITVPAAFDHNARFAFLRREIAAENDRDVSTAGQVTVKEAFGRSTIVRG